MPMRIIAWSNLAEFAGAHPEALASLIHWRSVTKEASWKTMAEVVGSFSKAHSVSGDRIRLEIAGGAYRLIVAFDFIRQIAFVKFIGAHAEYDRIDAATVSQF
jgi:mRNA interferase HigB